MKDQVQRHSICLLASAPTPVKNQHLREKRLQNTWSVVEATVFLGHGFLVLKVGLVLLLRFRSSSNFERFETKLPRIQLPPWAVQTPLEPVGWSGSKFSSHRLGFLSSQTPIFRFLKRCQRPTWVDSEKKKIAFSLQKYIGNPSHTIVYRHPVPEN